MRNVVFRGIDLEVDNGVPVFAECPTCGPTTALAPAGQNITLEDCLLKCQKCGGPASPLPGRYSFEISLFPMLASAGLTRQQVRRFEHKVEKAKNLASLEAASATINPALGAAVREARKQADPWSSVRKLVKWVKAITNAALWTAGAALTVDGALKLYDEKFPTDPPALSQPGDVFPDREAGPEGDTDLDGSQAEVPDEKRGWNGIEDV